MKEKLFNKIVKKDYDNKLEEILSNKDFSEDVKNSLLSVFYNIENGYKDYTKVKRETLEKNEYIENLMSIIQNECKNIIFLSKNNKNSEENIDKNKKEIKCFPIPNNILYSISKIRNKNIIVNYLDKNIEEAIAYLLDMGNNINLVEPLRDFNGFSWNLSVNEIEDIKCNLIYQNLIFIVGNNFLEEWINNINENNNYFDLFKKNIELKYGKRMCEKLIINIAHISVLIKAYYDEKYKNKILEQIKEIQNELKNMENKEIYLSEISKIKKRKQSEIRNIDKVINNKDLLKIEYEKQNQNRSQEKKIFSIRVLKNILIEERKEKIADLENLNKKMDPKYFFRLREYIKKILSVIELNDDESISKQIEDSTINLQKEIIKSMIIEIKKTKSKDQLIEHIYQYRYYNLLPFSKEKKVCDIEELKSNLNELSLILLNKASEFNLIIKICDEKEENINLIKKILITRIISLEDIYIRINRYNEEIVLTVFDEEIEDDKIFIDKNVKTTIKLNKRMKLLN